MLRLDRTFSATRHVTAPSRDCPDAWAAYASASTMARLWFPPQATDRMVRPSKNCPRTLHRSVSSAVANAAAAGCNTYMQRLRGRPVRSDAFQRVSSAKLSIAATTKRHQLAVRGLQQRVRGAAGGIAHWDTVQCLDELGDGHRRLVTVAQLRAAHTYRPHGTDVRDANDHTRRGTRSCTWPSKPNPQEYTSPPREMAYEKCSPAGPHPHTNVMSQHRATIDTPCHKEAPTSHDLRDPLGIERRHSDGSLLVARRLALAQLACMHATAVSMARPVVMLHRPACNAPTHRTGRSQTRTPCPVRSALACALRRHKRCTP